MSTSPASEPSPKRQCMDSIAGDGATIGTHDGTFHCDEVLACYMLKLLPKYKNATIVRTRDQTKLDKCSIVVDVGGLYDPCTHRYDHHQRSFDKSMHSVRPDKKWTTKLSSAGLVYCHFGEEIISVLTGGIKINDTALNIIYDKVYEGFVEEIDGIDNGIDQYEGTPRYKMSSNLSARVGRLNPSWNEEAPNEAECFSKAMAMVGSEFESRVGGFVHEWLPARSIVERSMASREEVDACLQIVKLERFCPWKEHLFDLEDEKGLPGVIKYVLYRDRSSKWRVQCVPAERHTFQNRLSMRSEWRGLRGEDLSKASGIPGCIFVHSSGFIGGNETYEGALEMALSCLNAEL